MKTSLLIIILLLNTVITSAQQKLKFTYDTAGNQILRDRICANCTAKTPMVLDSIVADSLAVDSLAVDALARNSQASKNKNVSLTDISSFEVTAYPNPVTQTLFVEWVPNEEFKPTGIHLFSIDGRKLYSKSIKSDYGEQAVEFGFYPPGLYELNISFTNGERRTFKILKN